MEHDIKLTTETPVRVKQYPLPHSMMEAVEDEVRNMLELKVIERSEKGTSRQRSEKVRIAHP